MWCSGVGCGSYWLCNLVAGVAILVYFFMEPEHKNALRILLHLVTRGTQKEWGSDGYNGCITAVDIAHKGGDLQTLQDCLTPFYNSTINSILPQKGKDLLGDLMDGIGGGWTQINTDLYNNGTELPFASSPSSAWLKKQQGCQLSSWSFKL